jgi:hypothetical protein
LSEENDMAERTYLNKLTSERQTARRAPDAPEAAESQDDVVRLQQYLGNQGVQRLLAEGQAAPRGLTVQAKMDVGPANDAYEQEADAVASSVMRQISSPVAQRAEEDELQAKRIQREAEEDELQTMRIQRGPDEDELQTMRIQREDEDEIQTQRIQREDEDELQTMRIQREAEEDELQTMRIQRVMGEEGFQVGGDVESAINSKRGGGQAMPDAMRSKMEGAFGQDFSGVRVHTDSESDSLNKSIGARAFTTGSDIFFGKGEYQPDSSAGQQLMAHELTHVVQQGASAPKQDER